MDRYSVEAEKYRAAAGYMAGHHNLYGAGPVDPVAAAAKYLESSASKGFNTSGSSSNGGDGGSQKNSSFGLADLAKGNDANHHYSGQNTNNNKIYAENSGTAGNDSSAAAKAYLETAKLYMDSKNYAAEVQRAYMDAAAKSIYGGEGKSSHDQHNSSSNSDSGPSIGDGVKNERAENGSSPTGIHHHTSSSSPFSNPTALASYYSQAAAQAAVAGGTAANGAAAAAALSGIVPLSLSQYAPPTGTYPSSSEYRRPLPVIF